MDMLWLNIEKIIDVFHFPNHISPDCKDKFSPMKVKDEHPDYNTQVGEQTFTWVSPISTHPLGCLYSVEWNGWWNGIVEWNGGMEWWNSGTTMPIDHHL